jgi:hypothetical protein
MAFGERLGAGTVLWTRTTPVTTAESPVLSPWINTEGFSQFYAIGVAAGGTTAVTAEWSFDGSTVDSDITATTLTPLALTVTLRDVLAPFVRFRWAQTVANATTSKLSVKARV